MLAVRKNEKYRLNRPEMCQWQYLTAHAIEWFVYGLKTFF
jgi:hypothetical protein